MLLEWLLKNNKVRLMLNIIWTNCFLLQFIPWHWFYIKLVCQSPNLKPTGMGWQLIGNSLVVYSGFKAKLCKTLLHSGFQAKLCTTLVALAWLTSLSDCSNAYDSHLGSHSHDVLPFGSTEIHVYGHRTPENTIFCLKKKSDILLCSLGSCDHIHWFQWLWLAIHHGYVTLNGSHVHWNKQKDL